LFGIFFSSIRTEPPWRNYAKHLEYLFQLLLADKFTMRQNQTIIIISYILWWFDTKIIEHFLNAFYFQIYKLFLKDCAPQQEKIQIIDTYLVCLIAKNTNPLYWWKLPKLSWNTIINNRNGVWNQFCMF
jgi:hypothetical protein